jgi:DNA-directed RNA polymerase subunit RPC12/RpoP
LMASVRVVCPTCGGRAVIMTRVTVGQDGRVRVPDRIDRDEERGEVIRCDRCDQAERDRVNAERRAAHKRRAFTDPRGRGPRIVE